MASGSTNLTKETDADKQFQRNVQQIFGQRMRQATRRAWVQYPRLLAIDLVKSHWPVIRKFAKKLVRDGEVPGSHLAELGIEQCRHRITVVSQPATSEEEAKLTTTEKAPQTEAAGSSNSTPKKSKRPDRLGELVETLTKCRFKVVNYSEGSPNQLFIEFLDDDRLNYLLDIVHDLESIGALQRLRGGCEWRKAVPDHLLSKDAEDVIADCAGAGRTNGSGGNRPRER